LTRGVQGRFLFVGERLCLDFVNTRVVVHNQLVDLLQGFPDWVEWSLEAKFLNPSQARQALRRWKRSPQTPGALEVARHFARACGWPWSMLCDGIESRKAASARLTRCSGIPSGIPSWLMTKIGWRWNAAWYSTSRFTWWYRSPSQPPISSLTVIGLSSRNVRTRHVFSTSMIRPRTAHVGGAA